MISTAEILRRRDFRDVLTFTIDPAQAKDFDDALSFESLPEGLFRIGVHIADVTHYVTPGDEDDKQAYDKGTSVYYPDHVDPMLPERLSNFLCSLRPDEDKLCMSVVFTMNGEAEVLRAKVCRTVIRSNYRLTYEQAQQHIDAPEDNNPLAEALQRLHQMALRLRSQRMRNGALDIEQDEIHFVMDESGEPTDVYFTAPIPANHLIEEFMLLANRTVAEQMSRTGKPMVYRVHDKPNEEKLETLTRFKKRMGDNLPQSTLDMLTVRAMAKAVYSPDNIGHYGLAFDYYTHFTSPIRRYPDMIVHRLVSRYLLGERHRIGCDDLKEACRHCSEQEQAATVAERDAIKQMQARWIARHIGEEYDGYISGVTDFGLFVTLNESHCDGLIHIRTLYPGRFLDYDEKNCCLRVHPSKHEKGKGNSIVLTLGDRVRVKVVRADALLRQIDYELVERYS